MNTQLLRPLLLVVFTGAAACPASASPRAAAQAAHAVILNEAGETPFQKLHAKFAAAAPVPDSLPTTMRIGRYFWKYSPGKPVPALLCSVSSNGNRGPLFPAKTRFLSREYGNISGVSSDADLLGELSSSVQASLEELQADTSMVATVEQESGSMFERKYSYYDEWTEPDGTLMMKKYSITENMRVRFSDDVFFVRMVRTTSWSDPDHNGNSKPKQSSHEAFGYFYDDVVIPPAS